MIVGRVRKRNQYRRFPSGGKLGYCSGPGTADDQIRLCEFIRHVIEEGREFALDADAVPGFAQAFIVRFAGLMQHPK